MNEKERQEIIDMVNDNEEYIHWELEEKLNKALKLADEKHDKEISELKAKIKEAKE